jgi:hypothetical protein
MCCPSCFSQNVLPIIFFARRCCQSRLLTEYAANYYFFPECAVNHVFSQNVLPIMFFPRMCYLSCFHHIICCKLYIFSRMCC